MYIIQMYAFYSALFSHDQQVLSLHHFVFVLTILANLNNSDNEQQFVKRYTGVHNEIFRFRLCKAPSVRKFKATVAVSNTTKGTSKCNEVLPKEPRSLVDQYKESNPQESSIIAKRFNRFTKPAYPEEDKDTCQCSGKCATKRCCGKAYKTLCFSDCACTTEKCLNIQT